MLDLPADAAVDARTAALIEQQLGDFLQRAGYVLAVVRARPDGDRLRVDIDEGRLGKIVMRGRSPVGALGLRVQLDLPHSVFNRPELERQLLRLGATGKDGRFDYELVPTRDVEHVGPQIDPTTLLPGQPALPLDAAYELHINLGDPQWATGVRLVAGIDPDSARIGAGYRGTGLLFDDDRWDLGAQLGLNYLEDLERDASELEFSRALAELRWYAPQPFRLPLRPLLEVREDLIRRQRQDLELEVYWWNRLEASASLSYSWRRNLEISLGAGVQQRDLFSVRQLDAGRARSPVEPFSELRPFASLAAELVLDPEQLRLDRQHRMELQARYFLAGDAAAFHTVELDYRKVFDIGWNDLWLTAAAGAVGGGYSVADAIALNGQYLRGAFGNRYYVDRVASAGAEFRMSLTRDLFKVGVFSQVAVFRQAEGAPNEGERVVATSFGPSFHALVQDLLQLDLYYSFGFTSDGQRDHGVAIRLQKAF